MWYLIGIVALVLIGFFFYANAKHTKQAAASKPSTKPSFRTEEDLNTYKKPMEDSHSSSVDFEDAD